MNKVFYISFCALDRAFHYPVHPKSHLAQRLGDFINHTLTNRFASDNAIAQILARFEKPFMARVPFQLKREGGKLYRKDNPMASKLF